MRTTIVTLLALLAVAAAVPKRQVGKFDQVQLTRQKDIIRLLTRYRQPPLWEDMATIVRDYKLQPENYKVPELVEEFVQMESCPEFLEVDQPFSVFDERSVEQIKLFFDLLYHAKDYDVFYKTALYLRERVNKGQFLVSFLMSVRMRQDTKDMILPPLYEIYPELFVTADAIQQVYDARLQGRIVPGEKQYYVLANYTGYPTAHTPEQMLSYFTEDVGLNEFFADFNYRYPYFLSAANYTITNGEQRGDAFYHTLRQLFARYFLERLSHGLPDVAPLNYDKRIETGYYPQIRLQNGVEMLMRTEKQNLLDADPFALERIWSAEYRLSEVVDMDYVISAVDGRMRYKQSEAINMLGNLVQGNADSLHPKYYGAFYNELLSLFGKYLNPTQRYGLSVGVFSKYETMLRDPAYFQIVKRILNIFHTYENYLKPYMRKELEFPGLKIESVDVDRMVTYFDNFDFEVDNSFIASSVEEVEKLKIFARQPRLNYKPFSCRIKVYSEKPTKAIFRVFYGPRFDSYGNEMSINEARQYFVEFDRFVYQVQAGENEFTRNSRDFVGVERGSFPTFELMEAVNKALQGQSDFTTPTEFRPGFPERLLLPRGSRDGLPLRLYVIASPLPEGAPASSVDPQTPISSDWFTALDDFRPVAFPFDRRIPHYYKFHVSNSYLTDVVVYHKTIDEINRPAA